MFKYIKAVFRGAYKILFAYPKIRRYAKNKDKYPLKERYEYAKKLINIAFKSLDTEIIVEGFEKVDPNETYLFVGNHQSFMDALAMISVFDEPMSFVTKIESKKYPFAGKVCEFIDAIFFDRDNIKDSVRMIKDCKVKLNNNTNVVIFPEGTRSKDENHMPGEYKAGALKSAYDTSKRIVVLMLDGSYKVLSRKYKGKQVIRVKVLEIIGTDVYKKMNTSQLSEYIRKITEENIIENRKHLSNS